MTLSLVFTRSTFGTLALMFFTLCAWNANTCVCDRRDEVVHTVKLQQVRHLSYMLLEHEEVMMSATDPMLQVFSIFYSLGFYKADSLSSAHHVDQWDFGAEQ